MQELNFYDICKCTSKIPKKLKTLMIESDFPIYIAGGFIRSIIVGDTVNDIDIFAGNHTVSQSLAYQLSTKTYNISETNNAFTLLDFKPPIQLIHRWTFKNYIELIDSFDFTICKAVIFYDKKTKKWKGFCDDNFYSDLAAKRLIYCNPIRDEEVGGSTLRLLKYYRKGFNAPLSSIATVLGRLLFKVHTERDNSTEIELVIIIRGLLIEVDPNAIVE